jgi:hypothetical protein
VHTCQCRSSEHQGSDGKFGNATEPYGEMGGVITAYSTGELEAALVNRHVIV